MRNAVAFGFVAVIMIFFASCSKCYKCHNECKVCRYAYPDTTLTIIVRSNLLSEAYYNEYIDSLTSPSLGWTCHDTTSDYQETYCEAAKNQATFFSKREAGLICQPE